MAGGKGLVNLGLFGDRRSAYRMLNSEGKRFRAVPSVKFKVKL